MLLSQIIPIENLVASLSHDHRLLNDHLARVVIQFETDTGSFELILKEIGDLLPAGTSITWAYQAGSYEITFIEEGGIYVEYTQKSIKLNDKIQENFAPLNWVDVTVHEQYGTGSIGFTDDGESCEEFQEKMRQIKNFIKEQGYTASLILFEADKLCPYNEAVIEINFEGGEL